MAYRGLRKTYFFSHLKRGETLIFVCSYGCVVGPLKTGLYKLNGGSGRRHAGPHTPAGPTTHP